MADATGDAASAPCDRDSESDDGAAFDPLDLPLPSLFARGAAIHRAAQAGTIPQVSSSTRLCRCRASSRGALSAVS